jgi:hypothetical protein
VQQHRRRALSQADVEAATDPCRSDGSRISQALIGSWVTIIGMLNLLRLRELAAPLYLRRRAGLAGRASAFAGLSSRALI